MKSLSWMVLITWMAPCPILQTAVIMVILFRMSFSFGMRNF